MGLLRRAAGLAAILFAGALAAACSAEPPAFRPTGGAGRVNPIYDAIADYPDAEILVQGLALRGLRLEIELEFDEATLADDDPSFLAEARVVSLFAGGAPQAFEVAGPLPIEGGLDDGEFTTGSFGPIRAGAAGLVPDLSGRLEDGARRVAGVATLYGVAGEGTFAAVKRRRYLVAGTDLVGPVGTVAVLSVRYGSDFRMEPDLEVTSSDPVVRMRDGRPLVVNRDTFDNLQGLDPRRAFRTAFQHAAGDRANPHDVVVRRAGGAGGGADEAFVTRFGAAYNDVAVLDLETGEVLASIDLAPWARNDDHLPRPDQAVLLDGLLYVTLEDANQQFTQFMNGRVVVIDPAARAVVASIDLEGQNPFESLVYSRHTGLLYAAMAGVFRGRLERALTGGVEAIDPETRTTRGLIVDDDDLGGNVTQVAIASARRGYCVVTDATFGNHVMAFDPETGEVLGEIFRTASLINTMIFDGDGLLLVAESSFFEPRILVFDAASGLPVAAIPTGVPPFSMAVLTRSLLPQEDP